MTKNPYTPPEAEDVKLMFPQVLATSDPGLMADETIDDYDYEDLGIE